MNPKRLLLPLILGGSLMLSGCAAPLLGLAAGIGVPTFMAMDKGKQCDKIVADGDKKGLSDARIQINLTQAGCNNR